MIKKLKSNDLNQVFFLKKSSRSQKFYKIHSQQGVLKIYCKTS